MTSLLSRLRVVELGRMFSAPWAGQMFADMGAEVIKIEAEEGDITRVSGGVAVKDARGRPVADHSTFVSVNRNKRSVVVDLKHPDGQDIARRLAATADVVIENFKAGDLERLGLGYEAVRALNPGVVYLSLSGFGQDGPYKMRPAMDAVVQAMSGYLGMTAENDGVIKPSPMVITDFAAGMYAFGGIMTALYNRDVNGGPGQYIDLSLLDAGIAMMSFRLQATLLAEPGAPPVTGKGRFSPAGLFDAADGRFQIAIGPQADFRRFAAAIDRPDLADNPDYAAIDLRIDRRAQLDAEVRPIFPGRNLQTWLDRFAEANVMFSPIYSFEQMMADPHVRARNLFVNIEHREGGRIDLIRNPLRMSETPIDTYRSPPLLGEDTEAVLRDVLGLDEDRIAALHASHAVRVRGRGD